MRALITGGTGFLGRHLARQLRETEWDVGVLVRSGSRATHVDTLRAAGCEPLVIEDSTASVSARVGEFGADVVFHLATRFVGEHAAGDIGPLVESNVLFGTRVLEGIRTAGRGAFICVGTRWQHFENAEYNPVSLYAATKQAFEEVARYYAEVARIPVLALHLTDCYGPGDERRKLLDRLLEVQRSGESLRMSPGGQSIDLLHVSDAVRALEIAGRRVAAQPGASTLERFAARSGRSLTLRELVALVERVRGAPVAIEWGANPYRARETFGAWTWGTVLPGWAPAITLEDGVRSLP
jgi:nucleoside-diphosphate-sugar epimerase